MSTQLRPRIDYTNKDYASLREALLELAREKLPEWTDHSPNDLGVVLLELFAAMGDMLLYYQDRIANESYPATAVEPRSIVNLLRLIGYELRPPRPATADMSLLFKEETVANTQIMIPKGAEFKTKGNPAISYRYIQDELRAIDPAQLPLVLYEGQQYRAFTALPVVQVDQTVRYERFGMSDGSAWQRFRLQQAPLIDETLLVRYEDAPIWEEMWARRESLLTSSADDQHYVVRRDEQGTVWIEFGDGTYGKIPQGTYGAISVDYLVGGGAHGNVPARAICEQGADKVSPAPDLVFNRAPATGGADRETPDDAVWRGPQLFRAGRRAVTARDYEAYAREYGVGKVHARAAGWNRVALYVAPAGGGYPTDTLKEDLRAYFEDKRMLTTSVEVREPVYVGAIIEADLEVEPFYYASQVQQQVEAAVRKLLAFDNVDFGDRLYVSKVYEAAEAVPGVAGITVTRFARATAPPPELPDCPTGVLCFSWEELPVAAYPQGIKLTVRGGRF